jgi:GPI mannosyltransferase 2
MAAATPPRRPTSVAAVALASRACLIAWAALTAAALPPYDTSGTLLQPARASDARPLDAAVLALCGHLGNWDGAYFTHLAAGGYTVEQFHAFYPGLPGVLRGVRATLLAPLVRGGLLSPAPAVLLAGVLTSTASFVAAAVLLEALSAAVLRDARRARLAGLLWCLTPAGVFTVAVYTER